MLTSDLVSHLGAPVRQHQLADPSKRPYLPVATLFLHRCRKADGHERLVQVGIGHYVMIVSGGFLCTSFSLAGTSLTPASAFTAPHLLPAKRRALRVTYSTTRYDHRGYFRFFTGKLDPANQSHFTIDYQLGNDFNFRRSYDAPAPLHVDGTIDGWLKDDDTILLKPRGGRILNNTWSLNDPLEQPATAPPGAQ